MVRWMDNALPANVSFGAFFYRPRVTSDMSSQRGSQAWSVPKVRASQLCVDIKHYRWWKGDNHRAMVMAGWAMNSILKSENSLRHKKTLIQSSLFHSWCLSIPGTSISVRWPYSSGLHSGLSCGAPHYFKPSCLHLPQIDQNMKAIIHLSPHTHPSPTPLVFNNHTLNSDWETWSLFYLPEQLRTYYSFRVPFSQCMPNLHK